MAFLEAVHPYPPLKISIKIWAPSFSSQPPLFARERRPPKIRKKKKKEGGGSFQFDFLRVGDFRRKVDTKSLSFLSSFVIFIAQMELSLSLTSSRSLWCGLAICLKLLYEVMLF